MPTPDKKELNARLRSILADPDKITMELIRRETFSIRDPQTGFFEKIQISSADEKHRAVRDIVDRLKMEEPAVQDDALVIGDLSGDYRRAAAMTKQISVPLTVYETLVLDAAIFNIVADIDTKRTLALANLSPEDQQAALVNNQTLKRQTQALLLECVQDLMNERRLNERRLVSNISADLAAYAQHLNKSYLNMPSDLGRDKLVIIQTMQAILKDDPKTAHQKLIAFQTCLNDNSHTLSKRQTREEKGILDKVLNWLKSWFPPKGKVLVDKYKEQLKEFATSDSEQPTPRSVSQSSRP